MDGCTVPVFYKNIVVIMKLRPLCSGNNGRVYEGHSVTGLG